MTQLLQEFQEFRRILCVCPCCGEIARVSDLKLSVKGAYTRTWLDTYESDTEKIDAADERFSSREQKLREIANEKGRKMAQKVFNSSIAPCLRNMKLDPYDIKPILNPIDYVVFNGVNKNECAKDILFLSMKYSIPSLNSIRKQIQNVVQKKEYDTQVARIDDTGNIVLEK